MALENEEELEKRSKSKTKPSPTAAPSNPKRPLAHSPFFPPQTWRPVHSPHGPSHSRSLPLLHRGPRSGPSHTPAPTPRLAPRQRPTRRPTCQRPRSLSRAPTLSATPGLRVSALLSPSFPAPQRPPEITGEVAGILIPLRPAAIPARPL